MYKPNMKHRHGLGRGVASQPSTPSSSRFIASPLSTCTHRAGRATRRRAEASTRTRCFACRAHTIRSQRCPNRVHRHRHHGSRIEPVASCLATGPDFDRLPGRGACRLQYTLKIAVPNVHTCTYPQRGRRDMASFAHGTVAPSAECQVSCVKWLVR